MNSTFYYNPSKLVCGFLLAFFFTLQPVFAQGSGSVKGRVFDNKTSEPLPGANVVVQNTSLGASTSLDGIFSIHNVPAGQQTLKVSYIGYVSVSVDVTVVKDSVIENDFRLAAEALEGEEVIVTAQAQGQNAAINQQLSSNTISNVVSAARIKELPDVNAAESIGRLPGVAINRSGGEANTISIRGLAPKYNLVTVNGVRLPSSGDDRNSSLLSSVIGNQANPDGYRYGGNDRSVDLSLVSSNTLEGIELKKANTPDMDADVLGGTVDLKLKEAPEQFQLSLSAQSGYTQLQKYYGNYNFNGNVSNRFFDGVLGLIVAANIDRYDRSADKLSANYDNISGTVHGSVVNSVNMKEEKVKRERSGANLLLDVIIPDGKVNANIFFNRLKSEATYRMNTLNAVDKRHYYDFELRHGTTNIFTGAIGVKQDYDWIRFDAGVSRTGSESNSPDERGFRFSQETGNVFQQYNTQDSALTPLDFPRLLLVDTTSTKFADAYRFDTKRNEYQIATQLNIETPFRIGDDISGYVKAGGKFRQLDRRNDEEVSGIAGLQYGGGANQLISLSRTLARLYPNEWNFERDSAYIRGTGWLPITRFLMDYSRGDFLKGQYPMGLAMDPAKVNQLMEAMINSPASYQVYQRYMIQSLGRDYSGTERYQAAYLMTELNFSDFITILPGVRWEKDYSIYHGATYRAVNTGGNTQGPPLDYTPTTSERKNAFWLPMMHLRVNPLDWMKVRLAFTKTLTRPDFRQYAPIAFISGDQRQIVSANGELRPSVSTNYDASVSVFDNSIGLFTVSGFYKEIRDLVFSSQYIIQNGIGPPPGAIFPKKWLYDASGVQQIIFPNMYSYPLNNKTPAYIRGIELEWQTHFWYLPSFLQGLVFNVNYTRIGSNVDIHFLVNHDSLIRQVPRIVKQIGPFDTLRASRVPDQPAHLLNFTLGYDYEGFSARLSYIYQSDRVAGINIYNSDRDAFTGDYARWDFSLQQSISDWGLQVYANFANLNAREDESKYIYKYYRPNNLEYYGFTADFGVRFKL